MENRFLFFLVSNVCSVIIVFFIFLVDCSVFNVFCMWFGKNVCIVMLCRYVIRWLYGVVGIFLL